MFAGNVHGVVDATVAPPNVLRIFLRVVLRIHDRHVDALDEINKLLILLLREVSFARPGGAQAAKQFVVWQIRDRSAARPSR